MLWQNAFIQRYSPLSNRLTEFVCDSTPLVFYNAFLNIHRSGVLTALIWLVPRETAVISARSVYIIYTTMQHVASCKGTYVRCIRV